MHAYTLMGEHTYHTSQLNPYIHCDCCYTIHLSVRIGFGLFGCAGIVVNIKAIGMCCASTLHDCLNEMVSYVMCERRAIVETCFFFDNFTVRC